MQIHEDRILIRRGKSVDVDVAVELIMISAESLLVNIFGGGDKSLTQSFLTSAWHIEHGQFGFGQHIVICVDDKPVGICTHWQKKMPDIFASDTAKSIVQFYTAEQAKQVIERSKAATYAILVPPDNAMIIGHVAVLPNYRRCGLAERLVDYVASMSSQQGKTLLGLDVEQTNTSAIKFYKKIGFIKDLDGPDRSPFLHMTMPI